MSAERLTSELIHQHNVIEQVGNLDDEQATTIRAVGGGVGFQLRSCVDAVFGMLLDPDPQTVLISTASSNWQRKPPIDTSRP